MLAPSQQILKNQHNYSFANNRSSLKNFEEDKFAQSPRSSSPIYQFKPSPPVYHYNEGSGYKKIQAPMNVYAYSPQHQLNHSPSGNFQVQRLYNFGNDNRQTAYFSSSSYNFKKIADRSSVPELAPPFNIQHSSSLNPSGAKFDSINHISSTLQSKLLNRELTQLKSDDSLKATVINDEGVQIFPVKFDSHYKE